MYMAQRPVPPQLAPHVFKPGHTPVSGRHTDGQRALNTMSKKLSKALGLVAAMECPPTWFQNGLEGFAFDHLSVGEAIALRVAHCLQNNVRFANPQLLSEFLSRVEGKVPLRVLHREETDADAAAFESMTDLELQQYIIDIRDRGDRLLKGEATAPVLVCVNEDGDVRMSSAPTDSTTTNDSPTPQDEPSAP